MIALYGSRDGNPQKLLLWALQQAHGFAALPPLARTPLGKPYFPQYPGLHFNLSHSGPLTVCALSTLPVGVDIEQIRPRGASLPRYALTEEQKERYEKLLNVSGDGIMAYIEIPKIGCRLPIYHGTKESALQIAAGHLEWSSLPVGGESAHCVISGHRGLPRAKLFTDLDKMEEGDQFFITVLNKRLTYEVDQIQVVEPEEVEDLAIEKGKDYVTLVTCTPYAINTHRLLVRGHRINGKGDSL